MRPVLYSPTTTDFSNNGIGVLHDCITCIVEEERNGIYECTFTYPVDGLHYDSIDLRCIIKVKPNQFDDPQPFRIYSISKAIKGIVTVKAAHLSYDLGGYAVVPFTATGVTLTLSTMKESYSITGGSTRFNFYTDKTNNTTVYTLKTPRSVRAVLGGQEGSILDVFGSGEYYYNGYDVWLYQNRGQDRGVTIRYGKNLTSVKQDENCTNIYTAVYPYWVDPATGATTEIEPRKIVPVPGNFDYVKVLTLDLSSDFDSAPSASKLRKRAQEYIEANNIGVPDISLSVSFEQLQKYDEYKDLNILEQVSLCDTVSVYFEKLGIDAKAKAIKVTYNCLLERVDKITLGKAKTNMADALVSTKTDIDEKTDVSRIRGAAEQVTQDILGATGGNIRFIDANGDGIDDTLYVADNPDPNQAVKVWRFNYEGWGASSNGYSGPFTIAASLNSGLVADFITAGVIDANLIRAGIITSLNNKFNLNIDNGTFDFGKGKLSYNGSVLNIAADTISLGGAGVATNDTVDSAISTTDGKISSAKSELSASIDSVGGDFNTFKDKYEGYIDIQPSVPKITLGAINSPSNVAITNTEVTIKGSGNATAVLGSSKMVVGQIETNNLTLGDSAWEIRNNGHISLKKVVE